MILCVGALGSGKSTLLKILQQHGIDLDAGDEEVLTGPGATGTTGLCDFLTLKPVEFFFSTKAS